VKKYQIILNNGLISQEIEAENGDKLLKKIDSGNYGIMPIGGFDSIIITRKNIKEIKELKDELSNEVAT
jgi:hypothetical protein